MCTVSTSKRSYLSWPLLGSGLVSARGVGIADVVPIGPLSAADFARACCRSAPAASLILSLTGGVPSRRKRSQTIPSGRSGIHQRRSRSRHRRSQLRNSWPAANAAPHHPRPSPTSPNIGAARPGNEDQTISTGVRHRRANYGQELSRPERIATCPISERRAKRDLTPTVRAADQRGAVRSTPPGKDSRWGISCGTPRRRPRCALQIDLRTARQPHGASISRCT
jgi:hypothetical protein